MEESATSKSCTQPTVLLLIGLAGSGKTTMIQRLQSELGKKRKVGYFINLDPAVTNIPYYPNIDIRDTVKYKEVMKQYQLGPNGAILTSCNLYATKFDQVMGLCEKERDPPLDYIVVDTPGQIEVFTWSASGSIVTELFARSFPTIVIFVVDTVRCTNPRVFMSNMLQACSILYKTRLPLLLAFNKTDIEPHGYALEWMKDSDEYERALKNDKSYASTLSQSMASVLEEFYENLHNVGVSAVNGQGMEEFFQCVQKCVDEYEVHYRPEIERKQKEQIDKEIDRQRAQMERLNLDMASSSSPQEHNREDLENKDSLED
eukprot:g7811.t1